MKTTIKAEGGKALIIEPSKQGGGVDITAMLYGVQIGKQSVTPDQCGAFIFALEQALESQQTAAGRGGVRCHGDACGAGQLPCPTPEACGVRPS